MVKKFISLINGSHSFTLSGALCFFLIMNGGAYIFLFVSLTGYFINYGDIINSLAINIDVKNMLIYLIHNASNMPNNIFLVLFSIYSSSSLYYHFLSSCIILTENKIDYKYNRRIGAVILSLMFIFFIFVVIIILSIFLIFFKNIWGYSLLISIAILLLILYSANSIAFSTFSIKLLKKGIIFSFLYIIIFSLGFYVFIQIFTNFKAIYGYFSAIIIFLFYLYMIVNGLLIGIRINWKNIEE